MPHIQFAIEHGRTPAEARGVLQQVVTQLQQRIGRMIQTTTWNDARDAVKLTGTGFSVELKVDDRQAHVAGDITLLGGLLGSPMLSGLKQTVSQAFQKRLGN